MTAPVVSKGRHMMFVLPSGVANPPKPNDSGVSVVALPERVFAVATYMGSWTEEAAHAKSEEVRAAAIADGYECEEGWEWYRYNPPWTLPNFKTNEVAIPIKVA